MSSVHADIAILGGGMVGLALAHQLLERHPGLSIVVIDKEPEIGRHSSGRNSGVLHAGVYYPPGTLKAQVCVQGARRLRAWCEAERLPVLACGKVIAPQAPELDGQLDLLLKRGQANGAEVHLIDRAEFQRRVPDGLTASGRALWSPGTCVVKPKLVLQRLQQRLRERGVVFQLGTRIARVQPEARTLTLQNSSWAGHVLTYGYLFNATGLHADRVAQAFGLAQQCTLLPFKGVYWQLDPCAPFHFTTNLYPVPDLNVPFLGVHVTPSPDGSISLGPTAIPAWGRENYRGLEGVEPWMAVQFLGDLASQWWRNAGGFRRYAREQALHGLKPLFLKAVQALVPELRSEHLIPSEKVGIRAQLYDRRSGTLVQDFRLEQGEASTHVLNAISPAFTASFALADLILDQSTFTSI
ncbi:L-2-hydroxyglutarate oxidase [Synechococcus sp. HJ21-Hayes]|uniref:L-2-hydroxyglutarate oxidase n=1 Tax=unclassified Synechococcus TaxID=2626047 RepID=UPI0020CD3D38|nr:MULTISPECIES: L-2-hydroxyglutarate oxidase [unclassified Synechococcus]MCP9830070.1 L-2-hydroxyglutarate oxidase [Synechococcus sp. JJ3a-Johnson]MCP9852122.1 L-2-hydroxyglutarate oxidase [Synechococcus sp. HJ21-Hayes]